DQNMRISDGELVVRAYFPPGAAPTKVVYTFDDATGGVEARAPLFSLGGDEGDGRPRPYSFVGLSAGAHRLGVKVTYADDSTAERVVPYVFQPLSQEVPGWERDILPIHQARCAKCHETGPGIPLNTYALWRDNAASIVDVLRDRRMPADGPLEPDLILKVQRWVQGGTQP
ncbi:MAG TPA: cytochrome c, partial [Myxococcaceae bacterium]|nr:cytochrome c [Myxococcaceae bacterium]